jgi:hypothetical protein
MGLAERRAEKEFKEKLLSDLLADIKDKLGFEVNIEIDWEKITGYENCAPNYSEALKTGYFEPISISFGKLKSQQNLQDSLKNNLHSVKFTVSGFNAENISLDSGVLTLDVDPFYLANVPSHRAMLILREIGNKLGFDGDSLTDFGKSVKVSDLIK